MLTPQQKQLYDFIKGYVTLMGVAPSYKEMRTATGVKSKSNIRTKLLILESKGYIRRLPGRSRCIEVTEPANVVDALQNYQSVVVKLLPANTRMSPLFDAYTKAERALKTMGVGNG
jgi:SOS-response transcriptional repressor LexA